MDTCIECGEPLFTYETGTLHVRTQEPGCAVPIDPPALVVELPPLPE